MSSLIRTLLILVLSAILASALECKPIPLCGTHHFRDQGEQRILKSFQRFQTQSSASKAGLSEQKSFEVFNFIDHSTYLVPATVRYLKTLSNGLDLVIWVEDTLWNQSSENHLNHQGTSSNLMEDRQSVIDEIGMVMGDIVIPSLEEIFGPIEELSAPQYTGMHLLIYDIKDTFQTDGGFIGGFFDPFDQNTKGENMNLLHMDVEPSNPSGWIDTDLPKREDFFHTLAHELYHLLHYQAVGEAWWSRITQWIGEGLAQFAIFRVFDQAMFPDSQNAILSIPEKSPSQVPFYLEFPEVTYLMEGSSETQPLSVEYYGLGYLFFTHLWHWLGSDGDRIFREFFTEKVDHIHRLRDVLSNNGYEFEDIFEDFVLFQFFDGGPFTLDFVDLDENSFSGRLKAPPTLDLSSAGNTQIAKTKMYEISYWNIVNPGDNHRRVRLESKCASTASDTCGICATPFHLLQLPSRDSVENCKNTSDPLSCFYQLGRNTRSFETTLSSPMVRPGTSSFAAWWSTTSTCTRGTNELHIQSIESEGFEGTPYFSQGPLLVLTENRLEVSFQIQDDNSEDAHILYKVYQESNPSPFLPQSSVGMEARSVSVGQSISMSWYILEDQWGIEGNRIQIQLFDEPQLSSGENFQFEFLGKVPVQQRQIDIPVSSGWNMLAFNPSTGSDTWGDLFSRLEAEIPLGDCAYGFIEDSLVPLSVETGTCSSQNFSWMTRPLQFGDGFFIHSTLEKSINISSVWPSRAKITLQRGWNLKSLFLDTDPIDKNFPESVPILYRYDPEESIWKKKVFYGVGAPVEIPDDSRSFHSHQAHWIYSLRQREFSFSP